MTSMPQQVLLRLPDSLAARFAQVVMPRQRSRFLIDLLTRELDREGNELALAAKRLNALEGQDAGLVAEADAWLNAPLTADAPDDGFDAEVFAAQFEEAQKNAASPSKAFKVKAPKP